VWGGVSSPWAAHLDSRIKSGTSISDPVVEIRDPSIMRSVYLYNQTIGLHSVIEMEIRRWLE